MPQGILYNAQYEAFARKVVEGIRPHVARKLVGLPHSKSGKWLMSHQPIRARIETLQQQAARRAELTREGIIREVQEEALLARAAGQHSAAIKAWELLGGELHNMFIRKIEHGAPGEFDGMSEEQLRGFIIDQMRDIGLLIDGKVVSEENGPTRDNGSEQLATKQIEQQSYPSKLNRVSDLLLD